MLLLGPQQLARWSGPAGCWPPAAYVRGVPRRGRWEAGQGLKTSDGGTERPGKINGTCVGSLAVGWTEHWTPWPTRRGQAVHSQTQLLTNSVTLPAPPLRAVPNLRNQLQVRAQQCDVTAAQSVTPTLPPHLRCATYRGFSSLAPPLALRLLFHQVTKPFSAAAGPADNRHAAAAGRPNRRLRRSGTAVCCCVRGVEPHWMRTARPLLMHLLQVRC